MLLPLAVHRSRGAAYVGWVIAAYNLGGLTAPLWGILADRYRLHRYLVVGGGVIAAAGLAAFPLIPVAAAWPALALLQGMGASGAATIANLFVVEAHPQEEWEARIGWLQTCYGGGQVCGLFVAAALTQMPAAHWLAGRSRRDSSRRADGMVYHANPSQPFDPQTGPAAAATTE